LDVTNALTVIRLSAVCEVVTGWRITIQLWVMTASLMN